MYPLMICCRFLRPVEDRLCVCFTRARACEIRVILTACRITITYINTHRDRNALVRTRTLVYRSRREEEVGGTAFACPREVDDVSEMLCSHGPSSVAQCVTITLKHPRLCFDFLLLLPQIIQGLVEELTHCSCTFFHARDLRAKGCE